MTARLRDKVAIVTGAGSGIGRETALRFAREGARVIVADRDTAAADETLRLAQELSGDMASQVVDVSRPDQTQNMVEAATSRFGRLDVLVNAAAVFIVTPDLAEVDERDWDTTMDVNLKGLFLCCKYAIPAMLRAGGGSIVNIASLAGIGVHGNPFAYAVSKAGVIHLTTVAANQYTSRGIRVNAVVPALVDTPGFRGNPGGAELLQARASRHPMGRASRPEEVANVILFLASDEASFVSGSTYVVDGGIIAGT